MPDGESTSPWDFESAISLLGKLSLTAPSVEVESTPPPLSFQTPIVNRGGSSLGDFGSLWDLLASPAAVDKNHSSTLALLQPHQPDEPSETETATARKYLRWRDEDGADLEDNIGPEPGTLTKTQRRAARRAKRASTLSYHQSSASDTEPKPESGNGLEGLRKSPDRTAIIDGILGRKRPSTHEPSLPTSSSPSKGYTTPKKQRFVAQSSNWTAPGVPSPSRYVITQRDGLMNRDRSQALISHLKADFPDEKKYLKNKGLIEPTFTTLNVSDIGIHVFIDISNISISFHDCLKLSRCVDPKLHVKQIPMDFHLFSLVLERGRPAAKRVLVGSDKSAVIDQAKELGFETNILERVHKAKKLTPRQKKFSGRSGGDTSASETNTGSTPRAQRWVEQAVDEILHLKILESLIDYSDKPSTIVLATGDAAEAEYSGGFLRMVERALEKGWIVELVSFKLNTSNLYKRKDFRRKWGAMFKWIQLDEYAETLIASDDSVFQAYYETHQLRDYSPQEIAWIPSLESFMMFIGGLWVGRVYDNYGPRYLLICGTFLHVFGLMMTSISTKYWHFILSQGLCSALGASMIFYPAMSAVVTWFFKKRAFAMGVTASGSGLGGIIFPIMVQKLIPEVGFGWSMRICAFLILGLMIVANITIVSRLPPHSRPVSWRDFVMPFTELPFFLLSFGSFLMFMGLFLPFNFLILAAADRHVPESLLIYLIPILNSGSVFGRIVPTFLADKVGRFTTFVFVCTAVTILIWAIWLPGSGTGATVTFAVLFGFASGAVVALPPTLVASISDVKQIGVRTGATFSLVAVAVLIGNPIGGQIVTNEHGSYKMLQVFSGCLTTAGTICYALLRFALGGVSLKKKPHNLVTFTQDLQTAREFGFGKLVGIIGGFDEPGVDCDQNVGYVRHVVVEERCAQKSA
ncbi:hypothetical protein DV736_g4682, partial [Chaetothyriales sp. CBS 134916]